MASTIPLLKDPKKAKVQETLLQYGIAPKTARAVAQIELRNWSSEELSTVMEKITNRGPNLRSFNVTPGLVSSIANLVIGAKREHWIKPPLELVEHSAKDSLALCVNAAGEWALLNNGYFAISHVWEEGIQSDPNNRGIPVALLQQIFQRIERIGAKWIWLDCLAIPVSSGKLTWKEEELKVAIINNLANIYQRAESVIIFDALVMQLRSQKPSDIAICLVCGKWMTRIWTYQEICLAKRALIMTGSGFMEFLDMLRNLRAFSSLDGHFPELLGIDDGGVHKIRPEEKSPEKYDELYLALVRLPRDEGMKPTLAQLSMLCYNRKTGNDVDYARAFFPTLGLTWKSHLTREQGMTLIYDAQKDYAKLLVLRHGSPRLLTRSGWAPSYLTGLEGRPIAPDDPLGEIEYKGRGLKRSWYTYRIKTQHPTSKENALLLEVYDSDQNGILCACDVSSNERKESLDGFHDAVKRDSAYILSNDIIRFPSKYNMAYNVMLVERDVESEANEAWVYLTAAVVATQKALTSKLASWLLLHESPISTDDQNGKDFSRLARLMSDEKNLHNGQGPLHIAAEAGNNSMLRSLLDEGVDIGVRDKKGWTALHTAAYHGRLESSRLLLEHGTRIDAEDDLQRSPLMLAADQGHNDIVMELIKQGANVNMSRGGALSPLGQALLSNHIETVKTLLVAGANPNGDATPGMLHPLLVAVHNVELVNLLIAAGAEPASPIVGDATVFHFAARAGNEALLKRLLEIGIPVDQPEGDSGITALYRAVEEQEDRAISLLLQHGANPNHQTESTWTTVLLAAKLGNFNILKMLVENGADVHTTCMPEGWTALHLACQKGPRLAVRLLLERGWNVNVRDAEGLTPLTLAQKSGHMEIAETIKRAGGV